MNLKAPDIFLKYFLFLSNNMLLGFITLYEADSDSSRNGFNLASRRNEIGDDFWK